MWHLNEYDLILLQELLLPGQDLLEEVSVDVDLRRQVELEAAAIQGQRGQMELE